MKSKFKILSISCLALVGLLTACNGTKQANPNTSLPPVIMFHDYLKNRKHKTNKEPSIKEESKNIKEE